MMSDDLDLMDGEELGPAMRALNERQRIFVRALVKYPAAHGGQLSRMAGFRNSDVGHRVTAHRLLHHPKIQAAIHEETAKQIQFGGLIGVAGLVRMAKDRKDPLHFRACRELAEMAGHSAAVKVDVSVDDRRPRTDAEKRASIVRLAAELGYPVEQMLGANAAPKMIEGKVIDE